MTHSKVTRLAVLRISLLILVFILGLLGKLVRLRPDVLLIRYGALTDLLLVPLEHDTRVVSFLGV